MESEVEGLVGSKDDAAKKKSVFSFPRVRLFFKPDKKNEVNDVVEPKNPLENHTVELLIDRAVNARSKFVGDTEPLRKEHQSTLETYVHKIEAQFSFSRLRKILSIPGVYTIFQRFYEENLLPVDGEGVPKNGGVYTPRIRKIMAEVAMNHLRWSNENSQEARTHELPFPELEKLMIHRAGLNWFEKLFYPTVRKAMNVGLARITEILLNPASTKQDIEKIASVLNRFSSPEIAEVLESKNAEGYSAYYYLKASGFNYQNYPTILGAENHVKANLERGGRFYDYARLGLFALLKELVKAGMDVNQKNYLGQTAETIARDNNHLEIADFLAAESRKVGDVAQQPNALDHAKNLYNLLLAALNTGNAKSFKELIYDFADKERLDSIVNSLLAKINSKTLNGKYKEMLEAALGRVLQLSSHKTGLLLDNETIRSCLTFVDDRYSWNRKRILGMRDREGKTLGDYLNALAQDGNYPNVQKDLEKISKERAKKVLVPENEPEYSDDEEEDEEEDKGEQRQEVVVVNQPSSVAFQKALERYVREKTIGEIVLMVEHCQDKFSKEYLQDMIQLARQVRTEEFAGLLADVLFAQEPVAKDKDEMGSAASVETVEPNNNNAEAEEEEVKTGNTFAYLTKKGGMYYVDVDGQWFTRRNSKGPLEEYGNNVPAEDTLKIYPQRINFDFPNDGNIDRDELLRAANAAINLSQVAEVPTDWRSRGAVAPDAARKHGSPVQSSRQSIPVMGQEELEKLFIQCLNVPSDQLNVPEAIKIMRQLSNRGFIMQSYTTLINYEKYPRYEMMEGGDELRQACTDRLDFLDKPSPRAVQ